MNSSRKEQMQQLIIHLLHSLEVVLFVIGTTFVTKTFLFDISFPHSRCSLLSITTTHCWKVTTRGSWKPANNSCMETWMKTWFENFCHLGNYIELLLLWCFHVRVLISDIGGNGSYSKDDVISWKVSLSRFLFWMSSKIISYVSTIIKLKPFDGWVYIEKWSIITFIPHENLWQHISQI